MAISSSQPPPEPFPAAAGYGSTMSVTTADGVAFVHLNGDLDLARAEHLRSLGAEVISAFIGTVRINLAEVTFMDSTALGALIGIRNDALRAQRVLILERPSRPVTRLLELTGLIDAFTIERGTST